MKPAEPSGPIQLIPPGLLGFLQLKSPAGQNPHVLNNDVQPMLDILPFYQRQQLELSPLLSAVVTSNTGAADLWLNGATPYVVPEREWWLVDNFTFQSNSIPAADVILGYRPAFRPVASLGVFMQIDSDVVDVGPLAFAYTPFGRSRGSFWLPPGAGVGWVCSFGTFAVSLTLTARMSFARFPI